MNVTDNSNLQVSHTLGEIVLSSFLQINNSGNARGTISKIDLILTKPDSPSFKKTLLAQTYSKPETSAFPYQQIPFGHIVIPPGETWDGQITFHEQFDSALESERIKIYRQLSKEINSSPGMRHGVGFKTSDILFNKMKSRADKQLESFKIGRY